MLPALVPLARPQRNAPFCTFSHQPLSSHQSMPTLAVAYTFTETSIYGHSYPLVHDSGDP